MIAGLLLAAGRSSRFGSDKLCAPLRGAPVIAWSARVLSPLDEILVVVPAEAAPVRCALAHLSARFVSNTERDLGMATSIRAGVSALSADIEAVVVALADQPFASPDVTARLVAVWREGQSDIVMPAYSDGRGHPVLFGRQCFRDLMSLEGDVGARSVTLLPHFRVTTVPVEGPAPLDVDTPDALALAVDRAPDDASISPPSV